MAAQSEEFPKELFFYAKGNIDISILPIVHTKEIRIYLSCTHSGKSIYLALTLILVTIR